MGQQSYKILFLLSISTQSLLPGPGENLDREWDVPKIKDTVSACFARLPGDYYRQGYARVYINPQRDAQDLRVERATFEDPFIASCLQSSLGTFRQKDSLPRSWSYAHIIAACDPQEVCGLTILLNNFAENEQLKILITGQTQRTFDRNSPWYFVKGAVEIIRFISIFAAAAR